MGFLMIFCLFEVHLYFIIEANEIQMHLWILPNMMLRTKVKKKKKKFYLGFIYFVDFFRPVCQQNSVCETVPLTSGFHLPMLYQLRDLMKVCVFAC